MEYTDIQMTYITGDSKNNFSLVDQCVLYQKDEDVKQQCVILEKTEPTHQQRQQCAQYLPCNM